jgi:hypothetical protein
MTFTLMIVSLTSFHWLKLPVFGLMIGSLNAVVVFSPPFMFWPVAGEVTINFPVIDG